MKPHTRQRGFSMIELLVALLILAIGLFGMASLMLTSMKSNQSAATRSQASWLAYDMIERMRLNVDQATTSDSYVTDEDDNAPNDPGCKANGCSAANTAILDLREWKVELANAGLQGRVERAGNNRYSVTISWADANLAAAAAAQAAITNSFTVRADL